MKHIPLEASRLGFYSQSGHTKDFKNSISSFRVRRYAQAEVQRILCMCCLSCMSLNSVQSFVIENCNGPTIENGLNNVCLHPLSRTFTLILRIKKALGGFGGMLPRKIFEILYAVLAILVLFEQFSGKLCLNFLPLILSGFTKYDAFCSYIFNCACLGRKAYCYRKGSKLWQNCIHQKHVWKWLVGGMHPPHPPHLDPPLLKCLHQHL